MIRFIKNLFLYFSVFLIVLSITLLLLKFTSIFTDKTGPNNVVEISELQCNKKIKKIYIGDSVGDQLFGHNKLDSNGCISMTLNAAMTVYGHYLLLDNFCKKNESFVDTNTEVVLIISLKGLATDLTRPTTYNYFVKPFYNSKFILRHSEPYVLEQLSQYKFLSISQSSIVKFRPYLTENVENVNSNNLISKINIIGIKKTIEFCNIRNLKYSIYIMPLSDYWSNEFPIFKKEFEQAGLIEIKNLLNDFKTTPDNNFVFDHVHFKKKEIGKKFLNGKNAIIKRIKSY